jgi:hypothetical protein
MKIESRKTNGKVNSFKYFNATFVETEQGLKVVGAFGANTISDDEYWTKLDSRNFARAVKSTKLVTK